MPTPASLRLKAARKDDEAAAWKRDADRCVKRAIGLQVEARQLRLRAELMEGAEPEPTSYRIEVQSRDGSWGPSLLWEDRTLSRAQAGSWLDGLGAIQRLRHRAVPA